MVATRRLLPSILCCLGLFPAFRHWGVELRLEDVPERGVQPQTAAARDGKIHLVFLTGAPGQSDVRHVWKSPGGAWSRPVSVNSIPDTAVAAGTIRGAQIALGAEGSVHVVWNGPGGKNRPAPLFYARSVDGGGRFEPQRDLRGDTAALDGGASVAAGPDGQVWVVWHAAAKEAAPGEVNRQVFLARSRDNGGTFSDPAPIAPDDPGVCACCSLKTLLTPSGDLVTLYRAAHRIDQRDVMVLTLPANGGTARSATAGRWAVGACPMSSGSLLAAGDRVLAAWEKEGKIFAAGLEAIDRAVPVSGGRSRHPSLAANGRGDWLVSWSVGTGWQQGGGFGWAILGADGAIVKRGESRDGVPVWSFTSAYADGDDFVLLH